ncbi:TspO/MBR family protein [Pseudooceanicola nanhaiensis]|uniref:TspO/MBR family protein n=1 Tax=Pseudooceanicola nanhaiensis TaxID=375761 RepID=UPI001CD35576|nr:TspO/MBR family protein [Pseudooceanicola nanhaiensis]MCA0919662.1 hypothetical protein [Pseudooceanicola nanhaiensis]
MMKMNAIFVLAAALAFAASPLVSTGFNGFSPDQFPVPQTDPPLQPAGWAFSIWGVIYLWLIVSAGYGLLKRDTDPRWDRTRAPLIASLVVGAAWIPVANLSPIWATVLIWIMWGTAVLALLRAPKVDPWWLEMPLGLYAGWLTAASCVATAVLATGYGAAPVTPIHVAFLWLAIVLGLGVLRLRPRSWGYAAALVWALIGVLASNIDPLNTVMLLATGLALLAVGLTAARQAAVS